MSETIIQLPKSGATVTLKDPDELRQKDREVIWNMLDDKDNFIVTGANVTRGLMVVLIKSWTLDLILPSVRPSSIGELHMEDYDAIGKVIQKFRSIIFPDFETDDNSDSPKDNLTDLSGN